VLSVFPWNKRLIDLQTIPEETRDEIIKRILKVTNPTRIILFGSHARGDADRDSDIDLLVVVEDVESRRELAVEIMESLRGIGYPKDVIVATEYIMKRYGKIPGLIYEVAQTEGIVLYAA